MPTTRVRVLLPLSFAARSGQTIHIQLQLPASTSWDGYRHVRLHRISGSDSTAVARLHVAAGQDLAMADVPSSEVDNGCWRLQVGYEPDGPFTPVHAFVLVSDPNPIALLVGDPTKKVEERQPRQNTTHRTRGRAVAHRLGGLADRALVELPPATAIRVRARARRAARRYLPWH